MRHLLILVEKVKKFKSLIELWTNLRGYRINIKQHSLPRKGKVAGNSVLYRGLTHLHPMSNKEPTLNRLDLAGTKGLLQIISFPDLFTVIWNSPCQSYRCPLRRKIWPLQSSAIILHNQYLALKHTQPSIEKDKTVWLKTKNNSQQKQIHQTSAWRSFNYV